MTDTPCKNVSKDKPTEACTMYKQRRNTLISVLIVVGILMILAPLIFVIVLFWVLPILGILLLVVALLVAFNVINVDKMMGTSNGKKR
jgi:uncharacterized membrane protein